MFMLSLICILISIGISIGILISLCIIFNWYLNWYQNISYCTIYLISKFIIYFNWYQYVSISIGFQFQLVSKMFYLLFGIKIYHIFQLVSNIKYFTFIGITIYKCFNFKNFQFQLVSKILLYLNICLFTSDISKFVDLRDFKI